MTGGVLGVAGGLILCSRSPQQHVEVEPALAALAASPGPVDQPRSGSLRAMEDTVAAPESEPAPVVQLPLGLGEHSSIDASELAAVAGRGPVHAGVQDALKRYAVSRRRVLPGLAEYETDEAFVGVSLACSAFDAQFRSAARRGAWCLTSEQAREAGLTVNAAIDERLSLERSTRAAVRLFEEKRRVYPSRIALDRLWGPASGVDVTGLSRLLSRVAAVSSPERFHLQPPNGLPAESFAALAVERDISFDALARASGVARTALQRLNPEVLGTSVPAGREVTLPSAAFARTRALLQR